MDWPIKYFKMIVIKREIKLLNPKKAPGYDLITAKVLKQLNDPPIRLITNICNDVLRLGVFPDTWKVAQIIVIPKPSKPAEEITSYRPISLLPIISNYLKNCFSVAYNLYIFKISSYHIINLDSETSIQPLNKFTKWLKKSEMT